MDINEKIWTFISAFRENLTGRGRKNLPKLTYYIGVIFLLAGVLTSIPSLLAFFLDENAVLGLAFLLPAFCSVAIGLIIFFFYKAPDDVSLGDAMIIAAIAWLIVPFIGALPFVLTGYLPFQHAFFESMSGFTGTGATIFNDVESLPRAILFWRSFSQWIGSVGVLVLFLSVLIRRNGVAMQLYYAEGRVDRLMPSIASTARDIWGIYIVFTILFAVLLALLGMPLFDSVLSSMSGMGTGGFSVKNNNIAGYSDLPNFRLIEIVLMLCMVTGAISFATHKKFFQGDLKAFFNNEEVRALLLIIFLVVLVYALAHIVTAGLNGLNVWDAAFQTVSTITTTGYSTGNIGNWSDLSKFALGCLMVIGGGFGSTASGIKLIRLVLIIYAVRWVIRRSIMPDSAVVPLKIGKRVYDSKDVMNVALYTVIYAMFLFIGTFVFMSTAPSLADAFFETASCLGNAGLTVGLVGPAMPVHEEILCIFLMWIGRLEIFPVLILFASPFRRY